MTIFAVMSAALFPAIHVGRAWNAYWLFPYPNQRQLWQNFKSPLMWDVFAVSSYFTVSSIFFYIGLIPDLAAVRDRTTGSVRKLYTALSLGWRGTDRQWRHYMAAYGFFAAFATPLVLSVHSVVSWDFAMAQTAGWHSTLFPPYFVAGAIFSGCAMVITLLMPMTKIFKWDYINIWHFESLAKMRLLTGSILTYAYGVEHYIAWYSDNPYEWGIFVDRATGRYDWVFYMMVACNCVIPLVWWIKKVRTNCGACSSSASSSTSACGSSGTTSSPAAGPPVRPGLLDLLHPDLHRDGHHGRLLRMVRHVVRHVRQDHAERRHRRDQGAAPSAPQV